ncbi:hypothetical protein C1I98_35800 [Spongiactinospora gelatinilytica]|uniref:Uncharacterized protein n=1 Tax=Spongiactinospora gelatinilytica TaxID=2666298 RepID=A0A2W2FHS7_9ACTN|nr:hypothetical protein C1I98_35800 [Spongiactinospora gelatinilytica]
MQRDDVLEVGQACLLSTADDVRGGVTHVLVCAVQAGDDDEVAARCEQCRQAGDPLWLRAQMISFAVIKVGGVAVVSGDDEIGGAEQVGEHLIGVLAGCDAQVGDVQVMAGVQALQRLPGEVRAGGVGEGGHGAAAWGQGAGEDGMVGCVDVDDQAAEPGTGGDQMPGQERADR